MKPIKLRMTWNGGEWPLPGQYFATSRTAYLILELIAAKPGSRHTFRAICERRPRGEAEADGNVWFAMKWHARVRRQQKAPPTRHRRGS